MPRTFLKAESWPLQAAAPWLLYKGSAEVCRGHAALLTVQSGLQKTLTTFRDQLSMQSLFCIRRRCLKHERVCCRPMNIVAAVPAMLKFADSMLHCKHAQRPAADRLSLPSAAEQAEVPLPAAQLPAS